MDESFSIPKKTWKQSVERSEEHRKAISERMKGNQHGKLNKGKKRTEAVKQAQAIRVAQWIAEGNMPKRYTKPMLALAEFLIDSGYELIPEMNFGPYNVDLYDPSYHIAWEADGIIWHDTKYDEMRDKYLWENYQLPVIRLTDQEIWKISYNDDFRKAKFEYPRIAYGKRHTHCKNGHEFTSENTYISQGKHKTRRYCKICLDAGSRKMPKLIGNQFASGYKHTPEAIAKIAEASHIRPIKDETRQKRSEFMKGKQNALGFKQTEEAKAKISLTHKGKPKSPEHIEKMRLAKLGKKRGSYKK